jgi:hypothetical protein
MKLHEFHIGERHSGAVSDGVSVSRRNLRIGRISVDLPASAGCKHSCIGNDLDRLAGASGANSMTDAPAHDQVEHARLLENLYRWRFPNSFDQRSRYFRTRLVTVGVDNPPARMRSLLSQLELSARLKVEIGSGSVKLLNSRGTFLHQNLDRRRIAKSCARGERILTMKLGRIPRSERCGNSALRVRSRAVKERPLGENHHISLRRSTPGSVKPGNAASDYEKAGSESLWHN